MFLCPPLSYGEWVAVQHPEGLGNQEHGICLYSFAFSSVQTGTFVSVGVILSLQLGHTYCQFRLRLRKERGDRPDSEPHVYIWKIVLPNKMDHFLNHRSGLLMNAEPSNHSWGTVKMPFLLLAEQRIIFLYPKGSGEPSVWVCLGNWSSQGSSKQPQAHSGSSGQQGAEGFVQGH